VKLIEALVAASQEFGIYGDWSVLHGQDARITLWQNQYTSYVGMTLVGQSERLEVVIARLAETDASLILSEHWQIARFADISPSHRSRYEAMLRQIGENRHRRELYGEFLDKEGNKE